jgi:hypothetical protein
MKRLLAFVAIAAIGVPLATAASASAAGGNSANAHACHKGGYQSLVRADLTSFANVGDCVSYAAHGASLAPSGDAVCNSVGGIFGNDDQNGFVGEPGVTIIWTCNRVLVTDPAVELSLDQACLADGGNGFGPVEVSAPANYTCLFSIPS